MSNRAEERACVNLEESSSDVCMCGGCDMDDTKHDPTADTVPVPRVKDRKFLNYGRWQVAGTPHSRYCNATVTDLSVSA